MTDVSAAYPVAAAGYIDTPGRAGNFVSVARPALTGTVNTVEWIVRFRMDTTAAQTLIGWGSSAAALTINADKTMTMFVNNGTGLPIGGVPSLFFPNLVANLDVWVRAKLTVNIAQLEYWYAFESNEPNWQALGTVNGFNPGSSVNLATSTPFNIGASASAGPTPLDGRVYFAQEIINGTTTMLRFDGNADLRGVVSDAASFPITNAGAPTSAGPPEVYARAVVTRDASSPKLTLVQPSLNRNWWPHSDLDDPSQWYRYPAFTLQRDAEGLVLGGDWVRGSTGATVEKTALRYPTSVVPAEVIQGKGILFTRAYDYETVEIEWGLPDQFTDKWYAVAIVRSAFGYPITVNDGQAIFYSTKDDMFPNGPPTGEDGNSIALMFENRYDMVAPPRGSHKGLPSGYWYYYSLFFQAGIKWYRSMVSSTLLPKNYGHSTHLWNALPPYYQWVDDQQADEGGDLRRFLSVFGFDLDTTREYVEQWQKLYWADYSPMRLLRKLGENFGIPYESGIGDVRYRSLLADIGYLYSIRGTAVCLETVIEAVSKCECDVLSSSNLLLLPDDSDFFEGTGHWAGISTGTNITPATSLSPDKIVMSTNSVQQVPPPVSGRVTYGRGTASVWTAKAVATSNIVLTLGDGVAYPLDTTTPTTNDITQPRYIAPRESALHVVPKTIYGFSIWLQPEVIPINVDLWLMWFAKEGQADDLLSITKAGPLSPANTNWREWKHFGEAPATARLCVPAVSLTGRPSQPIGASTISPVMHMAAASFYIHGTAATVARLAPDKYLNLGITELIGAPRTSPPFEGFVMGEPGES